MNVELLQQISEHIAQEPRRLDMNVLTATRKPEASDINPPCGTVGCIAGWACMLSKVNVQEVDMWTTGRELLGLTTIEADRLFTEPRAIFEDEDEDEDEVVGWPPIYAAQYEDSSTPRERADVTIARIEHFIKTKGTE